MKYAVLLYQDERDAPDLDTLTTLCALLPHAYAVEMRPVAALSDDEDWLDAART